MSARCTGGEAVANYGLGFLHAMDGPREASWHCVPLHKLLVPLDGAAVTVDDGRRRYVSTQPVWVPQGVAQAASSDGPTFAALFSPVCGGAAQRPPTEEIVVLDGKLGRRLSSLAAVAHALVEKHAVEDVAGELERLLLIRVALDRRVAAAVERLVREDARERSAVKLARQVGLSASRLSHLFVRHTGTSLRAFTSFVRIRHAVAQLPGATSIVRVASNAGFSDQAHLTRMCRKHFGRTPAAVRRVQFE